MAEQPDQMHQTRLKRVCRVCGCSFKHSRTSKNHKDDLMAVFQVDITNDSTTIHPDQFCEKCRTVLTKSKKAAKEGKVYMQCQNFQVAQS